MSTTTTGPVMRSSLFRPPGQGPAGGATGPGADRAALMATVNSGSVDAAKQRQVQQRHDEKQVERENDDIINALGDDVARLKKEAGILRDETAAHNQIIDKLSDAMRGAASGVRTTTNKLDNQMRQYGCKFSFTFALCATVVMIIFFYLLKYVWNRPTATPAPR